MKSCEVRTVDQKPFDFDGSQAIIPWAEGNGLWTQIAELTSSLSGVDVITFFARNPHTCDSAEELAVRIGRRPDKVRGILEALQSAPEPWLALEAWSPRDHKQLVAGSSLGPAPRTIVLWFSFPSSLSLLLSGDLLAAPFSLIVTFGHHFCGLIHSWPTTPFLLPCRIFARGRDPKAARDPGNTA